MKLQERNGIKRRLSAMHADLIQRSLHKIDCAHTGYFDRILECEKNTLLSAFLWFHLKEVPSEIIDLSFGHNIFFTTCENRCERALAGTVGSHNRVHFTSLHLQVDTVEDLLVIDVGL